MVLRSHSQSAQIKILGCWLAIIVNAMGFLPMPVEAQGPTYVSGLLLSDATWSPDEAPYVITGNLTVSQDATLTIMPGTDVRLGFLVSIYVDGGLVAVGTQGLPITFDSNLTPALPGDWIAVKFNSTSDPNSTVQFSILDNSAYGIWVEGCSPHISNNTIRNPLLKGIYLQSSGSAVEYNTIENSNQLGLDLFRSDSRIIANRILNSDITAINVFESTAILAANEIVGGVDGILSIRSNVSVEDHIIRDTGDAIYLHGVVGVVRRSNLSNNARGLAVASCESIFAEDNTILSNSRAVYATSSNVTIVNSTLESSLHDFHIQGYSRIISIGTSFDPGAIEITPDAEIVVSNYLRTLVREKNGTGIAGAVVDLFDNDQLVGTCGTNLTGGCPWKSMTSRIYYGSSSPVFNETRIEVTMGTIAFADNPRIVDMNTSHTEVFTVKNVRPTVNIVCPANNETVWGAVTVTGTATDSDGQIAAVELKIGQDDWQPLSVSPAQTVQWSFDWDTWAAANGTAYIFARAKDTDADWNVTSIFVVVENHGPIVRVTSHTDGDVVRGAVDIVGEASDDRGNVTSVMARIDDAPWVITTPTETNWSKWTYTFDSAMVVDGDHTITIVAYDDQPANSTVFLKLRVDNPEPASDSLLLLFSLVVVLVIVALILGVYAKRRRSRTATLELRAGPPVDRFSAKKEPSATVCDCPECGVEVSGEETECPNCGANLEGARVDEMERASADSLDRDTRIKVLRDLLERGRISREVYGANLVRLGARDPSSTGTSTDDGELSYLCPICDNEVDAAATECPSCGALFED